MHFMRCLRYKGYNQERRAVCHCLQFTLSVIQNQYEIENVVYSHLQPCTCNPGCCFLSNLIGRNLVVFSKSHKLECWNSGDRNLENSSWPKILMLTDCRYIVECWMCRLIHYGSRNSLVRRQAAFKLQCIAIVTFSSYLSHSHSI